MVTFLFYLPFLLCFVVLAVYAERKTAAFIQHRLGPMEVGPKGLFQTVADLLKMLQKEDVRATGVDKWPFLIAPLLVFMFIFAGYAVLPLSSEVAGAAIPSGVFFLFAIIALDVLGILMAGLASNSKFALYGALRAAAQMVSYEIPMGISVLCVLIVSGTLDLQQMVVQQGIQSELPVYFFGLWKVNDVGGFFAWYIFQSPVLIVVFIVFFVAGLAEANRTPFDLPESESELVGGYFTEYSGFRWGLFMLAEYGMMLLLSLLAAVMFFGGWNTPLPNMGSVALATWTTGTIWGIFWLIAKAFALIFVQMWVRWTFPRLRVDQLMALCWKYLVPISLILLLLTSLWKLAV